MKVHTLGPKSTDSYFIAKKKFKNAEIICHNSYDIIIEKLDELKGEYLLIPTAYKSSKKNYDWKDFNFEYRKKLELKEVFYEKTKTMILIENKDFVINKVLLHPATEIFFREYMKIEEIKLEIDYTDSKHIALDTFFNKNYRFVIASKDLYLNYNCRFKNKKILEIKEYNPVMVWCLYKIYEKEKKND